MSRTILIAEQSEIIRKGLVQITGNLNLFDNIHEISCSSRLKTSLTRLEPDVLIINPALIDPEMQQWLAGYRDRKNGSGAVDTDDSNEYGDNRENTGKYEIKPGYFRIAAIIHTLMGDELKDLFDEVIQVGDTGLKIKGKINSMLSRPASPGSPVHDDTLSSREKDVVRLLARGLSNKEISEELFISPHTVITHRKNITRKLNIKSVAGLIVYAIINGIVNVDELHDNGNL